VVDLTIGDGDSTMVGVSIMHGVSIMVGDSTIVGVLTTAGDSTMAGEILFGVETDFGIHIIITGVGIVELLVQDGTITDFTTIEVILMEEEPTL